MFNMHEAKSQLSKLVQKCLDGEEVLIAKNGQPIVKLVPYVEEEQQRKVGFFNCKIDMSRFDEPIEGMEEYMSDEFLEGSSKSLYVAE